MSFLRVAVLVALALLLAPEARAGLPAMDKELRIFDHEAHEKTGKLECKKCHGAKNDGSWVKNGKREHGRCFSCHTYSSICSELKAKEGVVCVACHTKFKQSCMPANYVRPSVGDFDFSSNYSHQTHIRKEAKTGTQCENCHGNFGTAKPVRMPVLGHAECSDCHTKDASPRFDQSCTGCHEPPKKNILSAQLAQRQNPYSVPMGFDHKKHAALDRVGTKGRECLVCHDNIAKKVPGSPAFIPLPTMQDCQSSCHNGTKAFDAFGTQCSKCHKPPTLPERLLAPVPAHSKDVPLRRFSHTEHGERLNVTKCDTCHQIKGPLVLPIASGQDHKPCSNTDCHASEFLARKPKLCVVCHDSIEPWREQKARLRDLWDSEFRTRSFSHATHAQGDLKLNCKKCHGDVLAGAKAPDAHPVCSECHERESKPLMNDCSGCHSTGKGPVATNEFNVRALFEHSTHREDPRSAAKAPPDCVVCHAQTGKSSSLSKLSSPTMRSCTACHNGTLAFKTTGFSCKRCHGVANSGAAKK